MINTRLKNYWFVTWYSYRFAWHEYQSIIEAYTQRDELQRLAKWAYRKKLTGVCQHYLRLAGDIEMRLLVKAMRHPQLTRIADWAYCAQVMLNPPPKIYPKGAGAKYRLRNRSLI